MARTGGKILKITRLRAHEGIERTTWGCKNCEAWLVSAETNYPKGWQEGGTQDCEKERRDFDQMGGMGAEYMWCLPCA
jgi:hypothetical protein